MHLAAPCRWVRLTFTLARPMTFRPPMKAFAASGLLSLALFSQCGFAAPPEESLVGCWRAVKIVLYTQEGSRMEDTSGRCMLHFSEDRFESSCGTRNGEAITTYQYRVERPNIYVTTMMASTFGTTLVGSTREYEYHVQGDRLFTVTASQPTPSSGATAAPRVELEATRTRCPQL